MEKQKNKPKNRPNRLKPVMKFIIFGILVFVVCFTALIILEEGTARIQRTSLPEKLQPLAQSILDVNPIDEQVYVTDDIYLVLEYFDFTLDDFYSSYGDDAICILGTPNTAYHDHSRVFINGSRVYGNYSFKQSTLSLLDRCVYGDLEPGLHLIEFHLRDSPFGEPIAIQQWAIEID